MPIDSSVVARSLASSLLVSAIQKPAKLEQAAEDHRRYQPGNGHADGVHGGSDDCHNNGGDKDDAEVGGGATDRHGRFHGVCAGEAMS